MSLTNYRVTRETLDKLVELNVLTVQYSTALGCDYWTWRHEGLDVAQLGQTTGPGRMTVNRPALTCGCLLEIERLRCSVEFRYDDDDGWSAEIEVKHGCWVSAPTLPEALAKALSK